MHRALQRGLILAATVLTAGLVGYLVFERFETRSRSIDKSIESFVSPVKQEIPRPRARPIPSELPDFTLVGLEGEPVAMSGFRAKTLVVNFWATWCAPCRREIPLLKALRRQHAAAGVEVIGVAVDFLEDVRAYAAEMQIDYPLMVGEDNGLDAAGSFGMDPVFPFTVFADARRRVVALKLGELHADEADFILRQIAEINSDRVTIEAVRPLITARLSELAAERARSKAESGKSTG